MRVEKKHLIAINLALYLLFILLVLVLDVYGKGTGIVRSNKNIVKSVIFGPTKIISSSSNSSDPSEIMNVTSIQDCVEEGTSSADCLVSNVENTDDIWQLLEITGPSIPNYGWINTTNDGTLPVGATINEVKVCWEGYGADTKKLGDTVGDKCAIAIGENSTGTINWYYVLGPSQAACAEGGFQSADDTMNCFNVTEWIDTKAKAENTLVHIYALDDDDRNIEIYIDWIWVNVTYSIDTTKPQWSNQEQNTSTPVVGSAVLLSAYWTDNVGLSFAILSTNETGVWQNKTTYGSPMVLSGTEAWSNFTWQNSSVTPGTVVGWKIYANDTSNNWNVTDEMTFTIQAEIIDVTLYGIPINFGNLDPNSVNQSAQVGNGFPMNVTIEPTTNVQTNLTLKGLSDFFSNGYSFAIGNLTYSNSSDPLTATPMTLNYPDPPPYANWINIPEPSGSPINISVYFWISIPLGQAAATYSTTITVRVYKN